MSVSGITEFRNRNSVISIVEFDQVNLCLFGGSISFQPLNLEQQHLQVKSILWLDIASYESAKVKFHQMFGGRQHKERRNKGALQSYCDLGANLFTVM